MAGENDEDTLGRTVRYSPRDHLLGEDFCEVHHVSGQRDLSKSREYLAKVLVAVLTLSVLTGQPSSLRL
jgi:hypothetical protein